MGRAVHYMLKRFSGFNGFNGGARRIKIWKRRGV